MPNLVLPTRALYVVNKAIDLFHHRGFHLIGVDRIVRESEITKATFYNYFHSKERLIEICLMVQKEKLQEQVVAMVEYDLSTPAIDKLKKLYFLHTDIEGPYYLLFKAVFEIKNSYPDAYQTAVRYRTWLKNEIYSQLRLLKPDVSFTDAELFLYMVEGTIIQLLSSGGVGERERLLDYFLGLSDLSQFKIES
ncbi:TPA: TetR/AcrR family transcriptional regulator [Acinetobacter baumannii]|jgi:AcrR family transcriptional regulator|uniref:TetR/AcrR family transcriptional regulator n=1 Tax=Acinetobacter baumannii TaxID=470 RepID=UPI0002D0B1F8|nr:TetR/AcrR family transcriptional regulator [Acinetobacter baumannii]EKU3398988.1 TetR/AcrR family transcriptional regulator [Acinetobacter baumannii]EKW0250515.1 TetR/AcrR family transcriptional regulator [Acinetobacter baumannii]EKW7574077.1 TetR/AcrR family transcriptional regulator [Acinetobacter baumannii]EKW7591638.1 TetR/AcrR family transcriptional regulator [Acinetobacter baumannii]EKW8781637.1 TetR/AcrR family transcriptional regulator [Acinetobacter baumannii]